MEEEEAVNEEKGGGRGGEKRKMKMRIKDEIGKRKGGEMKAEE